MFLIVLAQRLKAATTSVCLHLDHVPVALGLHGPQPLPQLHQRLPLPPRLHTPRPARAAPTLS